MRTLTASDRSALIRLASSLPAGSPERKAILAGLEPRGLAAVSGKATYVNALDNLADLAELVDNAQEIIDGFNLHYASKRVAGMDPQIASEREISKKLTEGQKLADQTVVTMENLVKLFPEEPKYAKALADAQKMLGKLTKQLEASEKIIHTVAKKLAPKALTEFSKKLVAKIKSRLIDPSQIETFFTQGTAFLNKVEAYFVVKAIPHHARLWIKEQVAGTPGIEMGIYWEKGRAPFEWKPATVDGAVEMFFENVKSWENVKGEAESQPARSSTAKSIASAIDGVTRRLSSYGQEAAKISPDFRTVEGAYRGNLPKEGAYSVGEYEYKRMENEEVAHVRKVVDAALAPYKSQIADVDITPEEKSWMYITVTLK
jgi:hypothetical protein